MGAAFCTCSGGVLSPSRNTGRRGSGRQKIHRVRVTVESPLRNEGDDDESPKGKKAKKSKDASKKKASKTIIKGGGA